MTAVRGHHYIALGSLNIMADVLLTLNGIGRGHLVRATKMCHWLRRAHRRPVIFYQGSYPDALALRIPGVGIPALYRLPPTVAQLIANDVARFATLSEPPVIIEDTHPAPVAWPPAVARFLVVRPTTFEAMSLLNSSHAGQCAAIMVCDHPESPSWPFGPTETATILSWPGWCTIGPMFRRPSAISIELVRQRYRIEDDEHVFVFSMGGGGVQRGSDDRVRFIEAACAVADELRCLLPRCRLLFVCGPLWPDDIAIPKAFERIHDEPELPSLLHLACGAVVRPGFNTTWECIAAATPFLPVPGTTYVEPVRERLNAMQRQGIDTTGPLERWVDAGWRSSYQAACQHVMKRFSGNSAEQFVQIIRDGVRRQSALKSSAPPPSANTTPNYPSAYSDLRIEAGALPGPKRLMLRLDGVVAGGLVLEWLIAVCRERKLCVSLEVIPYFARLDERYLNILDTDRICETSQHGYAYIPHWNHDTAMRGEFNGAGQPSGSAHVLLRRGQRLLRRLFPERFRGGYSAPYDGLPAWMPKLWSGLGGSYISWIATPPASGGIRHVQLSVDTWDWRGNVPKLARDIVALSVRSLQNHGSVGLVLHSPCLEQANERSRIEGLIDALIDGGCTGAHVSESANLH